MGRLKYSIWIGFDPRETAAFAVARTSIKRNLSCALPVHGLPLDELRARGLYRRPTERRGTQLWDVISDAPMSTEFALSRFLVPHLAETGWALFLDADVMVRANLVRLFDMLDPAYAVYCVQHQHAPRSRVKMDGKIQTQYARKNWSSVMAFNCDHRANQKLTVDLVNTAPGRDLHRFCWLPDELIAPLDVTWNFLAGHSDPAATPDPAIVHFTDGTPDLPGYENAPFADEWRQRLNWWAWSA
jgi:lipopolysaccharide biosynthesis glycosyltransferase